MELISGAITLASISGVVGSILNSAAAQMAWNALCMGSTILTYATLLRGRKSHKQTKVA